MTTDRELPEHFSGKPPLTTNRFEKAHTPTDDERSDMIAWLMRDHPNDLSPRGRDYTDAEIANALRRTVQGEPTATSIPRYAMLDVWMALYGHENSQAFDGFYEGAGYAEAWATLLAAIRARAAEPQGEPTDAQVDRRAHDRYEDEIPEG